MKKIIVLLLGLLLLVSTAAAAPQESFWNKYRTDPNVHYLIAVRHTEGTNAELSLYKHRGTRTWDLLLRVPAYIGENGMGKVREGDKKTPIGIFDINGVFGIKPNPGTALNYVHINKYHYFCGDPQYYNSLIDIRVQKHNCRNSEHMINHVPAYNYGLFIDYNNKHVVGKGSGIFVHCMTTYKDTAGCVAVRADNLVKILQTIDAKTKIWLY